MTTARLTEERLRTWLDSDQPARERLCVQVLSLDRRFSVVRPRQPKGGPDLGYDLEAAFHGGRRAVGAIGFRNSPSDNSTDLRWVNKKFRADLESARAAAGEFNVFVFLTNVRLTVGAKQRLVEHAKSSAITAEIWDREQLRLALDRPEGLAARYQFLQIPLTDAEQAAFFARWGADLEGIVTKSFAAVEDRLRRLEFMYEMDRPLKNLAFSLVLREKAPAADLPHFRAVLSLGKLTRNERRSQWNVGVCDNNPPTRTLPNCGGRDCFGTAFWLRDPTKVHGTSASSRPDPIKAIHARGGFNAFSDPRVVATLKDIDDSLFLLFMNKQLFERLGNVALYANEYLLWTSTVQDLEATPPNSPVGTPWTFTQDELDDPWVRVMPKGFAGSIHFADVTPLRMWSARALAPTAVE